MTATAATGPWARQSAGWRAEAIGFGALAALLLLLIPPNGFLIDNEEVYFGLAERAWSGGGAADSAVFDASRHRLVNEWLLGALIQAVGFEAAQAISRAAAALAYALALRRLFHWLDLSALDAVLVVVVYALMGQSLVGGEWLLRGYEAKVPA